MKRADINALEKTLAHLPVDLKQHLANQLLGQINAQAHTLLETASPIAYALTAVISISSSGGALAACSGISVRT
ncbi:hypothetical protein SAMN04488490_0899 [Marinobacter sp. LV10R510-11A]|nr:hypothetical protein SAMN04488490_0899 [Marinobacter sp. LV10R510-11A]